MPALARDFEIVAVDQRGIGLSDKPEQGYDTGTLANDLVGLMDALGHQRFAVVGVDTGMLIGYALAADHPRRVNELGLKAAHKTERFLSHQRPFRSGSDGRCGRR
jgi:pimeloyl-ACP methyl ester carboxylesterase